MFESRRDELLPPQKFLRRVMFFLLAALLILAFALGVGILGYHSIAGMSWIDAFLNASMILTGMGPVNPLTTAPAKLFASCYALFSGLVFITVTGVALAPVAHRLLHRFHMDEKD